MRDTPGWWLDTKFRGTGSVTSSSLIHPSLYDQFSPPYSSSRLTARSLRPPLRAAALGQQGVLGTTSNASRLVARIKDTMFHPINEMKARKRKASPGVIDLTCPTQKRSRSASGNGTVIVDEDAETPQSMLVGGEGEPGRSPSVELQDERPMTKGDVLKHMLSWSRLSMRQIRSAPVKPPVES